MQHLTFQDGIVDLEKVLGTGGGLINPSLPANVAKMEVAKVRLPQGELTALAPLFGVARGLLGWNIGNQDLDVLAEVVMFEPADQDNRRIEVGADDFVTMRRNSDVTVWITNEPHHVGRIKGGDILKAQHFDHYYDLLAPATPPGSHPRTTPGTAPATPTATPTVPRPAPQLNPPLNIDDPLCPICLIHSPTPLV
jgi:hypothetical protein